VFISLSTAASSLVIDAQDNPHVAYKIGGDLRYLSCTGGIWKTEHVFAVAVGRSVRYPSLALDSSSRAHISYCDILNSNSAKLSYIKFNGTVWVNTVVESTSQSYGEYGTSLALNTGAQPCIAYHHHRTGYDGKYACLSGTTWTKETFDIRCGYFSSLAFNASGTACVSYMDNSSNLAYRYRVSSGNWTKQIVDTEPTMVFGSTRLIFNPQNGYPCIGYYSRGIDKLKFAEYNGTSWSVEMVEAFPYSGVNLGETAMDIDSSGQPHLAYYNTNSNALMYAVRESGVWNLQVVTTNSSGYASLALTSTGEPVISHMRANGGGIEVITWNGGGWTFVSPELRVISRETIDSDSNGKLDGIKITTSGALNDAFSGLSAVVTDYAGVTVETGTSGDDTFILHFIEGAEFDTGLSLTNQITANTTLKSSNGMRLLLTDRMAC
jgi:hypothetical protein